MIRNIQINYRDGRSSRNVKAPNLCPHCGRTMSPTFFEGYSENVMFDKSQSVGILFKCSYDDCKKFFVAEYTGTSLDLKKVNYSYRPPIEVALPTNIEKVSEQFVLIYTQSTKAESEKLDQIAGVGYRKATEFLVKDYAIRNNPDEKEKIENMFLGKVIDKYLEDFPKIQNLARASTWIGNDETHYIRKHDDKDIQDMKAFILAAAQFIAADYDADEALDFTTSETGS